LNWLTEIQQENLKGGAPTGYTGEAAKGRAREEVEMGGGGDGKRKTLSEAARAVLQSTEEDYAESIEDDYADVDDDDDEDGEAGEVVV
jgi:hypothetical protein